VSRAHGAEFSPGAGGWPTMRYFNKGTGYGGSPYAKKTSMAMCDELGDDDRMKAYIMEAGKTALCRVADGAGCSEKELAFADKWKSKTADEASAELSRLGKMQAEGKMKPELAEWLAQRASVLKQLVSAGKDEL